MEQKKELSKKEIEAEVLDYLRDEYQADGIIGPEKWKEYDVYTPKYDTVKYLGWLTPIVLVKGNEVRPGTQEERLAYMDFVYDKYGDDTDELDDDIDEPMEKGNTLSGKGEH